MQVRVTVQDKNFEAFDVLISARQAVPMAEIKGLLASVLHIDTTRSIHSHGRLLTDRMRLGDSGLRSGCLLSTGNPQHRREPTRSVLILKVIAGPDSGQVIPLHRGQQVIGRSAHSDIVLHDPDLSRRHLRLLVGMHTVVAEDLGSANGTYLDGERLDESGCQLPLPSTILIGKTRVQVGTVTEPPIAVVPDGTGQLLVHRPPATQDAPASAVHLVPESPPDPPMPRIHWLAAAIPMIVSAGLASIMHSTQLLAFAALSPIAVLATALADRKSWRQARRDRAAEQAEAQARARAALTRSLQEEMERRHRTYPDAASVLQAAITPDCRLWERRPADQSFLAVRIGLADQGSDTAVNSKGVLESAGVMPMVPAIIALTERTIGVAGPPEQRDGLCRWLVGQTLVLHSPADFSVVVLADRLHNPGWRWLRWLPRTALTVATSPDQRHEVARQLQQLRNERKNLRQLAGRPWQGPWTLVIIEPTGLIMELPCLAELIADGPAVGITAICVAADRRQLPTGCSATVHFTDVSGTEVLLAQPGRPGLPVQVDRVSSEWAEQVTRSLACLRDAEHDSTVDGLAEQPRLSELLGLPDITATAVRRRWRTSAGNPNAPIGRTAAGVLEIDLDRDGPHLLIAGTTGSGKSELLRVLVTSLAAQLPPDEVSFVLIDYKGGAAFAECAELPHVTGVVTDLDAHLTRRALTSLNAELRRRESAFQAAGVSDLDSYRRSEYRETQPLTRLVLVIDEFASLAEELPEFLTGLLGIAQRGRSLGVHLVLATQRPAGVLSADIKANIGLRIALRMADAAESVDVLGVDTASRISRDRPGRAVARHADGQTVEFQTACVTMPGGDDSAVTITELDDWNEPIIGPPAADQPTELTILRQAIHSAAGGMRRPDRPWHEPLPTVLSTTPNQGSTSVMFGLSDEPTAQRQTPALLDLAEGGSMAFIGGPSSGRTTALRTVVGTAVSQLTADQLHVYILDCAGSGLRPLRQLPHCGAVLDAGEPAAVSRLVGRLAAERQCRQRQLAELGVASFAEARAAGRVLPAALVVLDGWEGFSSLSDEMDGGRTAELFVQLLREAPSAGFTFLVTGDRQLLGARIGPALKRKLLLPMTDRADYAMAGLSAAEVPVEPPPGRAVSADGGMELQLALLTEDTSTAAQWQALAGRVMTQVPTRQPPAIRICPLPVSVAASDLIDPHTRRSADDPHCVLGVGRDDASVIECSLFYPRARFLIAGPQGSGRSTTTILLAGQALSRGLRVTVAAASHSPLAKWAKENQIAMLGPHDTFECAMVDLLVIDDVEQFTDTALGDALQAWIATASAAVVVSARTSDLLSSFRGIGVEMRKHRSGLLLQPAPVDGELLGLRLPQLPASVIPGRGVLAVAGTRASAAGFQPIQVAA
ncbi:MAG: FtsK/SpoIIIE domain-containing protein [Jatrophihabitantaceae bacterium]